MGVTTQPQTGGAICVITLILAQKNGSCQEFWKPKGKVFGQLPEYLTGRRRQWAGSSEEIAIQTVHMQRITQTNCTENDEKTAAENQS